MRYLAEAKEVAASQSHEYTTEPLEAEESHRTRESIGLKGHNYTDAQTHEDTTIKPRYVPGKLKRR